MILQRDTQSPKTGSLPGVYVDLSYSGTESVMTSYYLCFEHPILSILCIFVSPERISVPVSLCVLVSCINSTGDSQLFNTSVYWA